MTISDESEVKQPNEKHVSAPTDEKMVKLPVLPVLPVIPLRDGVLFPSTEVVLLFGRKKSVKALEEAWSNNKQVIFLAQRKHGVSEPQLKDLYQVGTLASIDRILRGDEDIHALIRGISRVRVLKIEEKNGMFEASYEPILEKVEKSDELQAIARHLMKQFKHAINMGKSVELLNFMKLMNGVAVGEVADQIASTLDLSTHEKQLVLESSDLRVRLEMVTDFLAKEMKIVEIDRSIASKTQKKFDKHMKDTILRERMREIQKELGEDDDDDQREINDLRDQIKQSGMPVKIREKTLKELRRLEQMSMQNPESPYIRTWIEVMVELPWKKKSRETLSLKRAEKILADQHYGLEDVKERILEHLAVMKLNATHPDKSRKKAPTILCFVGAPGVGKTSIGRSIAEALGREFVKISLGGVHDEAEIRGHRRTYVGAMPGRIIHGLKTAGTRNPIFMLDEIDKLSADFHGDPSSALLEALDPEQNHEFTDHYLDVPFDLSQVMFITTANVLHTIPYALRDRLEVIEFAGYTDDEKFEIAKRHLLHKVISENGLLETQLELKHEMLKKIIRAYTREAGVRSLDRELRKLARKTAKRISSKEKTRVVVTDKILDEYLGPPRYLERMKERKNEIGLATGLAWTSVGGDVLFVEVATMPGKGEIVLTGQLGKVMQESARAGYTYVKSNAKLLGIPIKTLAKTDIHIHVPEGAVPKDGPSAGITIASAITSALSKRKMRKDIAMTGEVTLRGRVLEIGGLKEKVIAAHRADIRTVIIPSQNQKDVRLIPDRIRNEMRFVYAETMQDVLKVALL